MTEDFNKISYEKHCDQRNAIFSDAQEKRKSERWFNKGTVDYWHHEQMYKDLLPILDSFPQASWLTIGDGRYGTDANYLLSHNANVIASDISDVMLREANQRQFIKDFSTQNAEKLTYQDNFFDFVLCKESFHHFPRPIIALYEMLRVSKQGVVLIEPTDFQGTQSIIQICIMRLDNFLKNIFRIDRSKSYYEIVGNYIYTLSKRELIKIATALNYSYVAFHELNDTYFPEMENEDSANHDRMLSKARRIDFFSKLLCIFKIRQYRVISIIIFKNDLDQKSILALKKAHYKIIKLTKNPYL